MNKLPEALIFPSPVVFSFMMIFYKGWTETEIRSVGCITKIELSVLVLNVFLGTEPSVFISKLSYARLNKHWWVHGA